MSKGLEKGSIVAVAGSGAMGAGVAQVALLAGHAVRLFDTRGKAVDKVLDAVVKALDRLVERGKLAPDAAASARARLAVAGDPAQLADAALVVEAITEDLEAKRALFVAVEAVVREDCILATNTSSISVTAIGAALRRPERLVGMHFFNPAPLMALVEIVHGVATDPAVADSAYATAAAWGKHPVHATSTPGFIVNRVARPYYGEALRLLRERAAEPATIDAVMRDCGGFRMGPFELMDLIGLDIGFSVTQSVFAAYFNDPRYAPSVIQQELVNAGFLGRKTGRGFYRYGGQAVRPEPQVEAPQARPQRVRVARARGAALAPFEALAARLQAAGMPLSAADPADAIDAQGTSAFHADGAALYLTDGRSATQRACEDGHPDTIVFDLLLDAATAPRIALARADQCSEAAWQAAVGLFQAAGLAVTRLDDVPGLAVMRTVAMLANEAADAVQQGVCDAPGVDTAMRKGLNYPRGPLAWADAIGLAQVHRVLDNLAHTYGEDRYRISPLLRRRLFADPQGARFYPTTEENP